MEVNLVNTNTEPFLKIGPTAEELFIAQGAVWRGFVSRSYEDLVTQLPRLLRLAPGSELGQKPVPGGL